MTQNKAERNSLSNRKKEKNPKKSNKIYFIRYVYNFSGIFFFLYIVSVSLSHSLTLESVCVCVRLSVCWVPFIAVCSVSISTLTDTLIRVWNTPEPYVKADQHEHITWNIGESLYSPTVHKPTGFFSLLLFRSILMFFYPKKAKWETKTKKNQTNWYLLNQRKKKERNQFNKNKNYTYMSFFFVHLPSLCRTLSFEPWCHCDSLLNSLLSANNKLRARDRALL